MVKETKFYDILGVSRPFLSWENAKLTIQQVSPNATEAELKKAYKVGALKHHPGTFPKSFDSGT